MCEEAKTSDIDWSNRELGEAWGQQLAAQPYRLDYKQIMPMQHEAFLQQYLFARAQIIQRYNPDPIGIIDDAEKAWKHIREIIDEKKGGTE